MGPRGTTPEVPDEHAVLRAARAGHEGPGRLRAQGNCAWPLGHRARLRQGHRLRRREPVAGPAQGLRDLRPHRVRRGRALQRVREPASAGIRYADLRGYSYDRTDVTARALANTYAQTLGAVFTQESKPFEIEIVVAEVGPTPDGDQIFRLTYDGSVADEQGFVAMGGASEKAEERLGPLAARASTLGEALRLASTCSRR